MKAYLTQIEDPFSRLVAEAFQRRGFEVISGSLREETGVIDLFAATENDLDPDDRFDVLTGINSDLVMNTFERLVSSPVVALDQVLPYMQKSTLKRICFLTSAAASINMCSATSGYGYNMSKSALHMILSVAWNHYQPDGFSFRLYDPMLPPQHQGDHRVSPAISAETFAEYCLKERAYDPPNMRKERNDERLAMRDALGREWPW